MLAHTLDVVLQVTLLILGCLGIHVFLVGYQRYLRIDDSILPLWVMQNHVGLHLATSLIVFHGTSEFIAQTGLHLVVDALRQTLTIQQVAQNNLAHVTTHLVIASQHIRQVFSLLTQLLRLLHHQQHLLTKRSRMGCALLLVFTDSLLHVGDSILQWLRDARYCFGIRLLQFLGTLLQQLLSHILKALLMALRLFSHLLMQQLQLSHLSFGTCMQLTVLTLQVAHSAGALCQLLILQFQLHASFATLDTEVIHFAIHQQVKRYSTHCDTYYNIKYNHKSYCFYFAAKLSKFFVIRTK